MHARCGYGACHHDTGLTTSISACICVKPDWQGLEQQYNDWQTNCPSRIVRLCMFLAVLHGSLTLMLATGGCNFLAGAVLIPVIASVGWLADFAVSCTTTIAKFADHRPDARAA